MSMFLYSGPYLLLEVQRLLPHYCSTHYEYRAMLLLAAHPAPPRVLLSTDPPSGSDVRPSFRSWRLARGPGQPKGAPKGEGLSLKVSYACGRTGSKGGSYDGPREDKRL